MSKRAEQEALKAYPKEDGKVWHSAFGTLEFDKNAGARKAYQEGYEQAEKELVPLINRLCEAILFEWKDAADLARKTLIQIKERKE